MAMEIRSLTAFGESAIPYLDSTKLLEDKKGECIAFVTSSKAGTTKLMDGFFTFYLKAIDGVVIPARMFNILDFVEKGYNAVALRHKPVKVKFTSQIYNGRWSLILEDISVWEGDFDRSLFVGKLKNTSDELERLMRKTAVSINLSEWEMASFADLAGGNVGGYIALANSVISRLESYKGLHGIQFDILMEATLYSLKVYFKLLSLKDRFSVVPAKDILSVYEQINLELANNGNHDVICDACRGALELGAPQHLYSNLISRSIHSALEDMQLIYLYKSMPLGASTYTFDDIELVKFN